MNSITLALLLQSALPAPLTPRDTAYIAPKGSFSIGVFNPLHYALTDNLELETHPLLFFVSPNITARLGLVQKPSSLWMLAGELGFSVPTLAMRLASGYLYPTWETSENNIGWMLVPTAGLVLSATPWSRGIWTARADAALGVDLGDNNATPLNSFLAPLDIAWAAALTGFRGHTGLLYDHSVSERVRLRGEFNVYLTGSQGDLHVSGRNVGALARLSPWIVSAHAGVDLGVLTHGRVTLGVFWANYDQGDTAVTEDSDGFAERKRVRSNNVLPTLDFIWTYPAD